MTPPDLAAALGEHMERSDLSLRQLSERLNELGSPVSTAALSFWRSGRRRPEGPSSMDAVEKLEEIFDVAPGTLTSLVGPSRRRPRPAPMVADALMQPEITQRLFTELGFDFADIGLAEVSLNNTVDVVDGCMDTITTRTIFRATADGVDRFPLYLESDKPRAELFGQRVVHGCRLGRIVRDDGCLVQVTELLLDRTLAIGETIMIEVAADELQSSPEVDLFYEVHARRRIRDLVVWVRFHGRQPRRAEGYSGIAGQDSVELPVTPSGVHIEASGYGPGKFGVRWEW